MGFQQQLEEYKAKINLELDKFFNKIISENNYQFNTKLLEAIKEFTMRGGKRIRPLLVLEGFNAADGNKELWAEVLKLSICVELMQSSFLIHDDIMDESDVRRNKPTVHTVLGTNMAILVGNVSMLLAEKIIMDANFPEDIRLKTLKKFNDIVETTNYGQVLDLQLGEKPIEDVNEEEIEQIHLLKTSKYTIEGPLHLGGILAGASEEQLDTLSKIAILLGRAFQIQDDILGVFADEEKLGKSLFSDIQENKKTLLVWYAYDKADKGGKAFIKSILGKKEISKEEFAKLKKVIIDTGSLDYSEKKVEKLVTAAKENIKDSEIHGDVKEFLLNFADYLKKRDK